MRNAHLGGIFFPVRVPEYPSRVLTQVDRVLQRMLSINPQNRYGNMTECALAMVTAFINHELMTLGDANDRRSDQRIEYSDLGGWTPAGTSGRNNVPDLSEHLQEPSVPTQSRSAVYRGWAWLVCVENRLPGPPQPGGGHCATDEDAYLDWQ